MSSFNRMWTFLVAGSVYLIGVAIVLYLRPSYMFRPDGSWKEFGIGQREDRYTPFPFWMFCLVWALVAYVLIILLLPNLVDLEEDSESLPNTSNSATPWFNWKNKKNKRAILPLQNQANLPSAAEAEGPDAAGEAVELPKGYYVLNKKATRLSGVPKYVYLGPEEPSN